MVLTVQIVMAMTMLIVMPFGGSCGFRGFQIELLMHVNTRQGFHGRVRDADYMSRTVLHNTELTVPLFFPTVHPRGFLKIPERALTLYFFGYWGGGPSLQ